MAYCQSLMFGVAVFFLISLKVGWAEVIDVDNLSLQQLLEKDVKIIDLRRVDEWMETGVVEHSIKLTFFDKHGQHNAKRWLETVSELVESQESVILICHSGVRSRIVANWLDNVSDYPQIYNVKAGIAKWIEKELPVTSAGN